MRTKKGVERHFVNHTKGRRRTAERQPKRSDCARARLGRSVGRPPVWQAERRAPEPEPAAADIPGCTGPGGSAAGLNDARRRDVT